MSHFADNFLGGSHDLKLGVQFDSGGSDYILGPNDYIYTYGTEVRVRLHAAALASGWADEIDSEPILDDTYRLGSRVTLNLGLRYD